MQRLSNQIDFNNLIHYFKENSASNQLSVFKVH